MADGIGGGVARRRKAEQRRKRSRRLVVILVIFFAFLAALAGAGVVALVAAANYVDGLPDLDEFEQRQLGQNSVIFDRNGRRMAVIANAQNRRAVPIRKMSPWIQKATVAIEDRRFYQHEGVDLKAIFRAAARDIQAGEIREGGSTLTQQLVSQLFIQKDLTFDRKVREAWLALQLEDEWSKDKILETYLNTVFYGNNAYGIEAASQIYFNKTAAQLGVNQAALLAGLVQQPSRFDPFANPKAALARRNDVLKAMRDAQYISEGDYEKAVELPLGLKRGRIYREIREPFIVQFVRRELNEDQDFGAEAVRSGGLSVRTTVEPTMQAYAYQAMTDVLKTDGDPDAALVSINPKTGEILAVASTRPFGADQYDLATQGQRQPGSTFKTVTLATAIEQGIDPYTTRYVSRSFSYSDPDAPEAEPWVVHTADYGYLGSVTLESGTLHSDNTVFAQLALDVGPDNIADMAKRLGVRTSPLADENGFVPPSITLGSKEVSPLEMTSVYATLAAGGVYRKPRMISRVTGPGGKVLKKFRSKAERVITDGVAYEVTKILGKNMLGGTGTNARMSDGRPQAGKTGTADEYRNAWFCGYTPDIATCVWMGYPLDNNRSMLNVEGVGAVSGPTLPSTIWHLYMDKVGAEFYPKANDFPLPLEPVELQKYYSEFTGAAEVVTAPTISTVDTVEAEISTEAPEDTGGGEAPPPPDSTVAPPPPPPPDTSAPPPPDTSAPPPATDAAVPPATG